MTSPPSVGDHLLVDVIAEDKLLVLTLNRPRQLNAMTDALEDDLERVLDWFETNPALWVVIVTGSGRAFCAGQDLKVLLASESQADRLASKGAKPPFRGRARTLARFNGFGSLARRRSRKVIIAALNGLALGGGAEIVVNCDIVVGLRDALIGFPEVRRGVVASVGGIPNLVHRAPQLAPYLLTGLPIPPHLLSQYILTETVATPTEVLSAAKRWAAKVVECSPDAVQVTKEQINLAVLDGKGVLEVVNDSARDPLSELADGENFKEGLTAFNEKRAPVWRDPKHISSKL